jgi:hypothetical protein
MPSRTPGRDRRQDKPQEREPHRRGLPEGG